jgi:hypothetical protein
MIAMRFAIIISVAYVLLAPCTASAQFIPPGGSQFNPPLPAPPPPPRIEVPAIPQMDAPPQQPTINAAPRTSFGDRISRCLDEAAAAGLGPTERSAYSRNCANR